MPISFNNQYSGGRWAPSGAPPPLTTDTAVLGGGGAVIYATDKGLGCAEYGIMENVWLFRYYIWENIKRSVTYTSLLLTTSNMTL